MTLKELWDVTTCEIQLENVTGADGLRRRVKLPDGGRLLLEHAERTVTRITLIKRSCEPPYMLVETEDGK